MLADRSGSLSRNHKGDWGVGLTDGPSKMAPLKQTGGDGAWHRVKDLRNWSFVLLGGSDKGGNGGRRVIGRTCRRRWLTVHGSGLRAGAGEGAGMGTGLAPGATGTQHRGM